MNRNRCRLSILPILAAALVVLKLACKDANTITGVRVEPTPTPTAVNIAGAWTGTFNSFDFVDCESNVPAQATFTQQDSTVDGTLDALQNGCGTQNVVIHATFDGPSRSRLVNQERRKGTHGGDCSHPHVVLPVSGEMRSGDRR